MHQSAKKILDGTRLFWNYCMGASETEASITVFKTDSHFYSKEKEAAC
jgi:hypothetical protein